MPLTPDLIARTGLRLLNDVGLDGLTMRMLAKELGVQAPTLYWHVKNKHELLDLMAGLITAEAADGVEGPGRHETWQQWIAGLARRMRDAMLRYRDGARVTAGSYSTGPSIGRTFELVLRTLTDAGFPAAEAARAFPAVLHYVVGFTIEQQARTGEGYEGPNPYAQEVAIDGARYPLTASVTKELHAAGSDDNFEYGLRIVLAGMEAVRQAAPDQKISGAPPPSGA
ncbi:TetR/AcrR family transcriptional regulator C-terminal domain-containing protein [Nonomuraea sp. NPDC050783]|uniref:TetR/AcrR family transcriptional regulator C-terminal domain-containing protein n=1 Tax=Nonomuraea sp. NPDC050783 TaxID=3154634 RepID=UPI003465D145